MSTAATAPVVAPAAVLWDMDGTLVDTEPYWMACERELVDAFGGTWTEEDARSIIGFDLLAAAVELRDRGGVELEPADIVERMLDGVIARVRVKVPWRPGARRLLSELNDLGVPCALVTMSWSRLVDAVVDELAPIRFQAIVTGDHVRNGKPHAEPYLLAADRLGVDPTECVAIEDSPTGIESARAAGCFVVAVPNVVPIGPAPGSVVVPTLKEVSPHDLGRFLAEAPPIPPEPRRTPTRGTRRGARRRAALIGAGAVAALAVLAVGVIASTGGGRNEPPPRTPGVLDVHAWTPYWAIDDALPELPARADTLHELSPFWWRVTGVSSIATMPNVPRDRADEFIDTARARGVPVVASILDGTGAGDMARILSDPGQRATHVDAIAAFAADNDFDGIDIDYEQFAFADGRASWTTTRPNWVAFVEELATRLHHDGRTLTVSVPWISGDGTESDPGYWVYDYRSITPHVDSIRVMAYDYSIPSGEPGPIAPLPWVDQIIAATTAVSGDPSKLVLGVPLYGYNWVVGTTGDCPASAEGNISLSTRAMTELAARRGATPEFVEGDVEMRFDYDLEVSDDTTTCTQQREVRYMSGEGAGLRMQHAVAAGFGGVSLFAFGYEDDATWNAIDAISRSLGAGATTGSAPSSDAGG